MTFVEVAGAQLYVEDTGGDGTPVVFMHPASGTSQSWQRQVPAFTAAGFRCITYDLRGWGQSRSTTDEAGVMSDDLQALVDQLGLEALVLVAAAYGGFGGLDFALRFPHRVARFVLSASQGGISDPAYTSLRERVVAQPIRALPLEFRELGAAYRLRHEDGVKEWVAVAHAAGEDSARRQRVSHQIMLSELETLTTPTLLIGGAADLLAPPALMQLIAEHLPDCRFEVVRDAGHCVHWECPDEWNDLVLRFLR